MSPTVYLVSDGGQYIPTDPNRERGLNLVSDDVSGVE